MPAKHSLKYDGAPFKGDGNLVNSDTTITKGAGIGMCSCGEMSDWLPNGASRRRWHKWHKENLDAVQEEPTLELDDETAAAVDRALDNPDDVVPDPRKKEEPEEEEEDLVGEAPDYTASVSFINDAPVAGIFWGTLGAKASPRVVGRQHPRVKVSTNSNSKKITLSGQRADVQQAKKDLLTMWVNAGDQYKHWKKVTEEYKSLDQSTPEGRRASYRLTKAFFLDFGENYVR